MPDQDPNPLMDEDDDCEDGDSKVMNRHCERCQTFGHCECVPLMGYSEWLCRQCAAAAYHNEEVID